MPRGTRFVGGFTQEAPEGLVRDAWGCWHTHTSEGWRGTPLSPGPHLPRGAQALRAARARQDQASKQHRPRAPAPPAAPYLCVAKAQKSCRHFVHCVVLVRLLHVPGKEPLFASFILWLCYLLGHASPLI